MWAMAADGLHDHSTLDRARGQFGTWRPQCMHLDSQITNAVWRHVHVARGHTTQRLDMACLPQGRGLLPLRGHG